METNESEPSLRCRNRRDDVETGGRLPTGISLQGDLITVQAASGIEVV